MNVIVFRVGKAKAPSKAAVKAATTTLAEHSRVDRTELVEFFAGSFYRLPLTPRGELHDPGAKLRLAQGGNGWQIPAASLGRKGTANPAESIRIWVKKHLPFVDPESVGFLTVD